MKTIKYADDMRVECPVCSKVLLEEKDGEPLKMKTCSHVLLWHNSVCGEYVHIHRSVKDFVDKMTNELGDEFEPEAIFKAMAKDKSVIVHRFDGDYIGGDQYPVDFIAYRK